MDPISFSLLKTIAGFMKLILPLLPKEVASKNAAKFLDNFNDKYRSRRLKRAKEALTNNKLYAFLEWKYKEPILKRCGHTYPVAVYAAPAFQREDIESVLDLTLINAGILKVKKNKEDFLIYDDKFYKIVKGDFVIDAKDDYKKFIMNHLDTENELKIGCGLGMYSTNYFSSESLEFEIRDNIHRLKGTTIEEFTLFFQKLPLLSHLHKNVYDPIRDGSGRSAAIGISTLVAYNNAGKLEFLLRRRAKKGVPLRSYLNHVLPSAMFEPMTEYYIAEECSVRHNFYREYLEELFGIEEDRVSHPSNLSNANNNQLIYLMSLLTNGGAKLYFTGVTVNLMNLRPEICILLLITNPEWYKKFKVDPELRMNISDEFAKSSSSENEKVWVGGLPISTDKDMLEKASLYPYDITPAGAGAFWLGVDTIRDLDYTLAE